jgi:hypothetical protein
MLVLGLGEADAAVSNVLRAKSHNIFTTPGGVE